MGLKMVGVLMGLIIVIASGSGAGANRGLKEGEDGGGSRVVKCWSVWVVLKSCSNEIILFFLDGETEIGPECCHAIHIITHNCWPALLSSVGLTPDQGNLLKGYCDASGHASSSPATPAPSPYSTPLHYHN